MDLRFIFAFVLSLNSFNIAKGQFTNGANVAECDSLVPAGVTPSSGEAPFSVVFAGQSYTPGGNLVTVVMAARSRQVTAQGLVVQARRTASVADNTPVGTFDVPSNGLYRLLTCGSSTGGTITNTDSTDKPLLLQFEWNPPALNYGTVQFVVSLAENNGLFWSQVTSNPLPSTAGPLIPLTTAVCPRPVITSNVGTWVPPNCFRGSTVIGQASCSPPSGSTFPPGLSTITCRCSDRAETASCDINLILENACESDPCQNGGTCSPTQFGFMCQCLPGFNLPTCSGNPCFPNPCANGGSCFTSPGTPSGFVCICLTGFVPPRCDPDLCFPNPCENGGTCSIARGDSSGFECNCPPGLFPPTCGFISPCNPNPCQNGGTCVPTSSGFTCVCPVGLVPPICSDQDACSGNPCFPNECRVSSISIRGFTCHSETGIPCI